MPDTCPTCGGPCTTTIVSTVYYGKAKEPINRYRYESLGEVVAEGMTDSGELEEWKNKSNRIALLLWKKGSPAAGDIPILVIQKEDSMTGGKE